MRRFWIAVFCAALTVGVLVAPSAASAVGCHENYICTYESVEYNNPSFDISCSVSGEAVRIGVTWRSATNRCGNKTDWLRLNGTTIACMNPGGNRPSPGNFNEVFVAAEFGAFC
ncbi:MAG TPA: hypothetical protein VFX44_08465 [Solirubrobacterales bacterium]|nr:hypothetical protein [Solirubrobacterales bacterium]